MTGKEIIETVLDYLGLTPTEFSRRLGFERPDAIFNIQSGKTKTISKRMASTIKDAYPAFRESWLLTGEGNMLESEMPEHVFINKSPQTITGANAKEAMSVIHRLIKQLEDKDAIIREQAEAIGRLSKQLEEKDTKINELTESNGHLAFAFEKLAETYVVNDGETVKKGVG